MIDSGENWLVCGGSAGIGSGGSGRLALLCGGVLASVAETPAPVHSLCECDGLIVSVGAEGFLRNWSRDLSRVITTVSTSSSLVRHLAEILGVFYFFFSIYIFLFIFILIISNYHWKFLNFLSLLIFEF